MQSIHSVDTSTHGKIKHVIKNAEFNLKMALILNVDRDQKIRDKKPVVPDIKQQRNGIMHLWMIAIKLYYSKWLNTVCYLQSNLRQISSVLFSRSIITLISEPKAHRYNNSCNVSERMPMTYNLQAQAERNNCEYKLKICSNK